MIIPTALVAMVSFTALIWTLTPVWEWSITTDKLPPWPFLALLTGLMAGSFVVMSLTLFTYAVTL